MTDDELVRVKLMADGDPTWDLSDKDIAALQAVLIDRDAAREEVERLRELAKKVIETIKPDDPAPEKRWLTHLALKATNPESEVTK